MDESSMVFYLYAGNYRTGKIISDIAVSIGDYLDCEGRIKEMLDKEGFSDSIWGVYCADIKSREESEKEFADLMKVYGRVYE